MWALDSDSGRCNSRAADVNRTTCSPSATKTIQLARSRTCASRLGSAPSSQASSTPRSVRAPRITSLGGYPRTSMWAEFLVERDELGRSVDLLTECAYDLGLDPRRAAWHRNIREQRGNAFANGVQ